MPTKVVVNHTYIKVYAWLLHPRSLVQFAARIAELWGNKVSDRNSGSSVEILKVRILAAGLS